MTLFGQHNWRTRQILIVQNFKKKYVFFLGLEVGPRGLSTP